MFYAQVPPEKEKEFYRNSKKSRHAVTQFLCSNLRKAILPGDFLETTVKFRNTERTGNF